MTTATETPVTTRTCPPSAVVDMIARWEDVPAGELVLHRGEFVVTQERDDSYSEPAYVGFRIGEFANGTPRWIWQRRDHYTAVRRYTEGISERDALFIAALDEAAADRDERGRESGCPACADATLAAEEAGDLDVFRGDERDPYAGLCSEHRGHAERAAEYRAERDRREAGR